jgi:hypothetical protein
LDFNDTYKPASRDGCKFGQFIGAVLNNEIIPCGMKPGLGIKGLLFSGEQAKSFSHQIGCKRKGDLIYLTDAAKLLGISAKVAFFLKEKGLLPAQKAGSSSHPGFLVSKETIEHFKATYVQASEVARRFSKHQAVLPNLLSSVGITPVCGPKIDGRGWYFFRVSDLEALDLETLLGKQKAKPWIVRRIQSTLWPQILYARQYELWPAQGKRTATKTKAKRVTKPVPIRPASNRIDVAGPVAAKTTKDNVQGGRADVSRRAWVTLRANREVANSSEKVA